MNNAGQLAAEGSTEPDAKAKAPQDAEATDAPGYDKGPIATSAGDDVRQFDRRTHGS